MIHKFIFSLVLKLKIKKNFLIFFTHMIHKLILRLVSIIVINTKIMKKKFPIFLTIFHLHSEASPTQLMGPHDLKIGEHVL